MNNRLHRSTINFISGGSGYILPMLFNIIATPLLIRGLGEAAYGLQSLVAVIIGYLLVMEMGLDLPIVKLLAEDRAKKDIVSENHMLSTTLQLYGLIGLIGMTIIILGADWLVHHVFKVPEELKYQATFVFRLAGVGFFGSIIKSWGRALSSGLQRYEITQGVTAVSNMAGMALGLLIVYSGFGVVGYVLIRVIFTLVSGPIYWLLVRRLIPTFRIRWGLDQISLRRVRGYAGYGMFNKLVSSLLGRLDQTLIGIWLGVAAVGIYSVPIMILNSLGNLIANTLGFIFPLASEFHGSKEMDRMRDIFIRTTRFVNALVGMIFVPFLVLGDIFLSLWVPSIAGQAISVFRLMMLAGLIGIPCASLTNLFMVGMGYIKQFTIYATSRSVVFGALCFLLIHPFGLEGAGFALFLTVVVDGFYLIIVLRNFLKMLPLVVIRIAFIKPIALSFTLGLFIWSLRTLIQSWFQLIGVVIVFEVIYISVGYWIGVFGDTEKRAIVGLWRTITR